ncbi:MAG: response regulator, partial [Pseudomonadota bacterium]
MRVLLIEDESQVAQSIELMLKSEGFNVYTTDLGEEGIDLGKIYDYDIILLDLGLPDMNGYDVLKALRVAKVKTPILILSGRGGIDDKVRGLGFGADDYLTKPRPRTLSSIPPRPDRIRIGVLTLATRSAFRTSYPFISG